MELHQRHGRLSYRAFNVQFELDDDHLALATAPVRCVTIGRIIALALGLLLATLLTDAQQAEKVRRIGWLGPTSGIFAGFRKVFLDELRSLGWVEGHNFVMQYRLPERDDSRHGPVFSDMFRERDPTGKFGRLPEHAVELVRRNVAVIVAPATPYALAAKRATTKIPIVFVTASDPVGIGLVANLARPGENITGLSSVSAAALSVNQLVLLKEAMPGLSRVAVLSNPTNPATALMLRQMGAAARSLGIQLHVVEARDAGDIRSAFKAMPTTRASALVVLADPMFYHQRTHIANLAATHRLPAAYGIQEHAYAGGLMSSSMNVAHLLRRAAVFVDQLLKGANPADLPVEQPTAFELVINLKTATALGLTIPSSLLFRADQVIR